MNVDYSKDFKKSVKKLSGKMLDSVRRVVAEVKSAESIKDITDCKKLVGYRNVYRIRIGDYRAFFTFHIEIVNDTVFFRYLVPRGEAYGKKTQVELKRMDEWLHFCNSINLPLISNQQSGTCVAWWTPLKTYYVWIILNQNSFPSVRLRTHFLQFTVNSL